MAAIVSSLAGRTHAPRVPAVGAAAALVGLAGALTLAIGALHLHSATISSSKTIPLTERVVAPGAFSDFVRGDRPIQLNGAARWALAGEESTAPARETARLQHLGFVAGVHENLYSQAHGQSYGTSIAERFSSPASARSELIAEVAGLQSVAHAANGAVTTFSVAGIPGADGWSTRHAGTTGTTVAFAYGSYYYLVGVGGPTGHGAPVRASVIHAAERLYLEATGCIAPSTPQSAA
jgi:hypothetical protein